MRFKREIFPFIVVLCIFIALIIITRHYLSDEIKEISCDNKHIEQGSSFETMNSFSPIPFMTRGVSLFFH